MGGCKPRPPLLSARAPSTENASARITGRVIAGGPPMSDLGADRRWVGLNIDGAPVGSAEGVADGGAPTGEIVDSSRVTNMIW